jgi:stringent starvation protein A
MVTRRSRLATHSRLPPVAAVVLFVTPLEPWSDLAALVLAEKNLDDVRVEPVDAGKPHEDLLVINPQMKLPALTDRELLLTGGMVLAEYLDERYPHPRMVPQDPANRAKLRMVMEQFRSELFPILQEALAPKASAKTKAALSAVSVSSARWFGSRGYFLGSDCTLADLAWAIWFKGLHQAGLKIAPSTTDYRNRLAQRPAVSRYWKNP